MLSSLNLYEKSPHIAQNSSVKITGHKIRLWETIQCLCTFKTKALTKLVNENWADSMDFSGERGLCIVQNNQMDVQIRGGMMVLTLQLKWSCELNKRHEADSRQQLILPDETSTDWGLSSWRKVGCRHRPLMKSSNHYVSPTVGFSFQVERVCFCSHFPCFLCPNVGCSCPEPLLKHCAKCLPPGCFILQNYSFETFVLLLWLFLFPSLTANWANLKWA